MSVAAEHIIETKLGITMGWYDISEGTKYFVL
jgi:hypothetical protein